MQKNEHAILFDWGGTLMVEYPEYSGPMVTWPEVAEIPGANEILKSLSEDWTLCLATNGESDEAQIRSALERVNLHQYLDKIFCYQKIGVKKPSEIFFNYILRDLGIQPGKVIMVGDSYEVDIQGALRSGMRGIWLNRKTPEERCGSDYLTIHDLSELPRALRGLIEET